MFHYAWWGCAALGAYWLLAGLFGRARGPLVGGLGLFAEAAGASWLLWNHMYPAGMPLAAFLLHGLYLSVLCAALAQFVAAFLALPRGDARALVDENIAENEFDCGSESEWLSGKARRSASTATAAPISYDGNAATLIIGPPGSSKSVGDHRADAAR